MSEFITKNGLGFWHDDALAPFPHGFFSRLGGVSQGEIAGLNCGYGADDARTNVDENRKRVTNALGAKIAPQTVFQHHSPDVIVLEKPLDEAPKADAIVTKTAGLTLGVLTADCAPVLFADHKNGVIAVAHSGWRGAIGGVLENTIQEMTNLGAEHDNIHAVVGPCISMNNYEVGAEFAENFITENPQYSEYFSGGDKIHFNLPRFVLDRIRSAGVENAHWIGECTYADDEKYYSYRRSTHKKEADYGRLIASIVIP